MEEDDFDFNFDDLSDEEKEEIEKEQREERLALETSPVYIKAFDIYNTVNAFGVPFTNTLVALPKAMLPEVSSFRQSLQHKNTRSVLNCSLKLKFRLKKQRSKDQEIF
jgi:hypothetical protein